MRLWPFGTRQKREQYWGINGVQDLLPADTIRGRQPVPVPSISSDQALRHSAVWSAVRLRANLLSTLPVDVFRYEGSRQIEQPKPSVLVNPGGERVDILEWLYSSQVELDRTGNSIGIIREFDSSGKPRRIDLKQTALCSVLMEGEDLVGYRINGTKYPVSQIWHEKQYTISGLHVGLSPVAYAAYQLGEYQSVLEFALNWFGNSAVPRVSLKNTQKKLRPTEATIVKMAWRGAQALDEPFVHGNDWELNFLNAEQNSQQFIDIKQFSVVDIARFFDVPADLIDGSIGGRSDTYANIVSRRLDFLTLHLGPAITRRERALSKLVPGRQFVKLNSDALLRMDPKTRAELIDTQLRNHSLTVTEARNLDNRAPLTPDELNEVMTHFPPKAATSGVAA